MLMLGEALFVQALAHMFRRWPRGSARRPPVGLRSSPLRWGGVAGEASVVLSRFAASSKNTRRACLPALPLFSSQSAQHWRTLQRQSASGDWGRGFLLPQAEVLSVKINSACWSCRPSYASPAVGDRRSAPGHAANSAHRLRNPSLPFILIAARARTKIHLCRVV